MNALTVMVMTAKIKDTWRRQYGCPRVLVPQSKKKPASVPADPNEQGMFVRCGLIENWMGPHCTRPPWKPL